MAVKVIFGSNGSGKSIRVDEYLKEISLSGKHKKVSYLKFKDSYGASDVGYYLQQRFNSCDFEDGSLISLSSGELRKYLIDKALKSSPDILVIDNPYVGLDGEARGRMLSILQELSVDDGLETVLLLSRKADIPQFAASVISLADKDVSVPSVTEACSRIKALGAVDIDYDEVLNLRNVSINFAGRKIFENVNWRVMAGEKWALEGRNGSGKSTLLSIVCADIPQAYACDVTLFGRKRGSGESIWDIKKHIGYVSPELHRAYCKNVPVCDVVASGLHDRNGLYVKTDESLMPQCEFWMDVFGILHLKDRSFIQISSGEQRLALLARAFVKDPELLILDEPLHGLDDINRNRVMSIIDAFCLRKGKSLIMVSHYKEEFPSCIEKHFSL